jgi:hypothetical protein
MMHVVFAILIVLKNIYMKFNLEKSSMFFQDHFL